MNKSFLLVICLLSASFTGCLDDELKIEEEIKFEEDELDNSPFIVSGWDDGAPEGYSLTSHTMMYEEVSSTPNGECYELAKSSLGTWSIVNLADDWIIDGSGYGNSVYERDTENIGKPHDTLYKSDSVECIIPESEEEESEEGCNQETQLKNIKEITSYRVCGIIVESAYAVDAMRFIYDDGTYIDTGRDTIDTSYNNVYWELPDNHVISRIDFTTHTRSLEGEGRIDQSITHMTFTILEINGTNYSQFEVNTGINVEWENYETPHEFEGESVIEYGSFFTEGNGWIYFIEFASDEWDDNDITDAYYYGLEEEEICDASQITNVEVLPSSIYPGSFQITWNYPDDCVSEEQEGDYWEQRTEYLPPGNGWHAGGGYGERLGSDTWGYDHPNYWLGATDCERSGLMISITIRINSDYRVESGIDDYMNGPHSGYMSMADCSEEEEEGCMDPDAINYDSEAEVDDGSCEYPPVVCELVPYGHCSGENFSGQDLSYLNLTGIDLSYTNLAGANLGFTNLAFADLSYANLSYVKGETMWDATKLLYANLSYANLRHANLHSTIINYANLEGADISYANGYSTKFNEAYMADAILNYTNLQWPQFAWVDLSGANFNEAYLDRPFLSEADLSYADFTDAIVTDGNFINTTWYQTIWTDGIVYDEDPTITEEECELVPYGHCSGADFSGQDLSGMNLTGIDLSYANLTDANLTDATLSDANFEGADLSDANFEGADLSNAYLGYADLIYTYLRYADLTGANLEGADLYRAAFDHVDMAGADLTYAELSWASFWGANLAGSTLESVTTYSGKALFQYADLSDTNLINADLSDANLYDADLNDANLESADLSGAWLGQADLTGAYLVGANLTYADFEDTTVTDADFTDTIWYQTIWTDGETYDENQAD